MLFRSRGRLCNGTIYKALVQTAGGQKGVTFPSPEPRCRKPALGRSKSPLLTPNATSTDSEQEAGWSGEIVESVLENSGNKICLWNHNIPSKSSLTTKSLSENASSGCPLNRPY